MNTVTKIIFPGAVIISILFGMFGIRADLMRLTKQRRTKPYFFSGDIFLPVKKAVSQERSLGYLTDRDIKNDAVAMHFSQAQFILAPAILDLNNPNHHLLILDFDDPKKAITLAAQLGARPLKVSPQGIVLAERPNP